MSFASSARRPGLGIVLGLALAAPLTATAQTPDSGAGTGPSQRLSTPPDAAAINQPGAMRRSYAHHPKKPPPRQQAAPATQSGSTPH